LLDGPDAEYPVVAMRDKPPIEISPVARTKAVASIRRYFREELDQDIGDLKAALLFEYFLAEHGPTIYNQGIADARAFFEERSADLAAICYQIEFPFWERNSRPDASQSSPQRGRK
jgi:uncharacterized protein (DUF2164 family)